MVARVVVDMDYRGWGEVVSNELVMGGGAGLRSRHSAPVRNNPYNPEPNVGRHYSDGQFPHLGHSSGACMCYRRCCWGTGGCVCADCSGEGHVGCVGVVAARRARAAAGRKRSKAKVKSA